jgi:hypothetical protein
MTIHDIPSELTGTTVKIKSHVTHFQFPNFGGEDFIVEDWADRVFGRSWMDMDGNPACLVYAIRGSRQDPAIPIDNNVLYGKVNGIGCLLHVNELEI